MSHSPVVAFLPNGRPITDHDLANMPWPVRRRIQTRAAQNLAQHIADAIQRARVAAQADLATAELARRGAAVIALDHLPHAEVAELLGVTRETLYEWRAERATRMAITEGNALLASIPKDPYRVINARRLALWAEIHHHEAGRRKRPRKGTP